MTKRVDLRNCQFPDPMPFQAAVIIPHFEDTDRLRRCLTALMPQVTETTEVLVADNASRADVWSVCREFSNVRLVVEPVSGAAHARNCGVAETTAERLFFLDSDCVPAPDWLSTAMLVSRRADLVGGTLTVFDEAQSHRLGAAAFETVFAFDNQSYIETKGFSVTANLLTTRIVFDAVGGFREGVSEDLDWCHRATAAGFRLVHEDGLRVMHPTRADWPALEKKWRRLTRESWGLERGKARARVRWVVRALMMIPSILVHSPKVLRHKTLSWPERGAAFGTLVRLRMRRCGWMLWQAGGGRI